MGNPYMHTHVQGTKHRRLDNSPQTKLAPRHLPREVSGEGTDSKKFCERSEQDFLKF